MAEKTEESYDILDWFPIPYCRKVFEYLSGKDVLEASAVSRKWYKFTAESQQAAKYKLAFNAINQQNLTTEAKEMLRDSNRRYQNVEFNGFSGDGLHFFINLLGVRAGDWKSVTLRDVFVDKESTFIKIFQIIEPSVEELTIEKIHAKESSENAMPDWSFPNLKSLDCAHIPEELNFSVYFYGCRILSRLKWHTTSRSSSSDKPAARISRILYNNPDLKHLNLSSSNFMSFRRLNNIRFKLRELRIVYSSLCRSAFPRFTFSRTHLFAFLEAQAQTLEILDLEVRLTQELLELILTRMPRLTSFAMEIHEVGDAILDWEGEYPVNTSITTLNVHDSAEKTRKLVPLEILIKAMPNLKNLKCKSVNDKLFSILAREAPAIEIIDTSDFKVSRFPESNIFPNFKSFKGDLLRKGLQEPIGDGNFAVVVRKEMERYFAETSYDILEWFPIRVCQNVFKYLRGRDVIRASLVNKEWYKFTAESQQAAKLKLRFTTHNGRFLTAEAKDILKNSKRKYQNFWFDGFSSDHSDFYFQLLVDRAGSLKSVILSMVYLEKDEMARLFGIIEPTVEELTMLKVDIRGFNGHRVEECMAEESKWTFPRLKLLNCPKMQDNYDFYQHFYNITSISKLRWSTYDFCGSTENSEILPVLRNNADLTYLDVYDGDCQLLEHSSEYKFRLRKLVLDFESRDSPDGLAPLLYAFLEAQAQSLESLETNVKLDQEILQLILNKMPRLSSLTVTFHRVSDAISDWQQSFPVNGTISTLVLNGSVDDEHLIAYQSLFRALPGLKNLKLGRTTDEQFKFLAQAVPALESIEAGDFSISRLPEHDIFPNIRRLKVTKFNDDFPEPTGDYEFAALVRKKMRSLFLERYFKYSH